MKNHDNIEELIRKTDIQTDPAGDRERLDEILDAHRSTRGRRGSIILGALSPLKLAAAVVLIAVGFVAARAMSPAPVDVTQLEIALRSSLQREIAEAVAGQLGGSDNSTVDVRQIADAVRLQLRTDMPGIIEQILAASQVRTDERLLEMAQLIEDARVQDRRQVAAALQQIEASRLQDRTRMGHGLLQLAARGDTSVPDNHN